MYDIDIEMIEFISVEFFKYGKFGKLGGKILLGVGRILCWDLLEGSIGGKGSFFMVNFIVYLFNGEFMVL